VSIWLVKQQNCCTVLQHTSVNHSPNIPPFVLCCLWWDTAVWSNAECSWVVLCPATRLSWQTERWRWCLYSRTWAVWVPVIMSSRSRWRTASAASVLLQSVSRFTAHLSLLLVTFGCKLFLGYYSGISYTWKYVEPLQCQSVWASILAESSTFVIFMHTCSSTEYEI